MSHNCFSSRSQIAEDVVLSFMYNQYHKCKNSGNMFPIFDARGSTILSISCHFKMKLLLLCHRNLPLWWILYEIMEVSHLLKGQENLVYNLNQAWFFHNFEVLVFYIIFIDLLCARLKYATNIMTVALKFCPSRYRWMPKYASWSSKFFVLSAKLLLWGCLAQSWQLWWEESRPVSLSWITLSCCVQAVLLLPLLLALFSVSVKGKCLVALSSLVQVPRFTRNPVLWYILCCFVGTPCSVNLHVICYCVGHAQ
jgi:hypothetical protein